MKNTILCALIFLLLSLSRFAFGEANCMECHKKLTPRIVADHKQSAHFENDHHCDACHGEAHQNEKDVHLALIPTAQTCEKCHEDTFADFSQGKHAKAWKAMQVLPMTHSLPEGITKGTKGCGGCHKIGLMDGDDIKPWRYAGMGCVNCHGRHSFSAAEARKAETCSKCHLGFDHPQWEIWSTSAHGVARKGEHGKTRAPTCVTCHMPAGRHGNRTAWGFYGLRLFEDDKEWKSDRSVIFKAMGVLDAKGSVTEFGKKLVQLDVLRSDRADFEKLRTAEMNGCRRCHSTGLVTERFKTYEETLRESDRVMAEAIIIVRDLIRDGVIDKPAGNHGNFPDVLRFYEVNSSVEQELYVMFSSYRNRMHQGAWHDNWDYMHWEGWAKMRKSLVELRVKAGHLRRRHLKKQ